MKKKKKMFRYNVMNDTPNPNNLNDTTKKISHLPYPPKLPAYKPKS